MFGKKQNKAPKGNVKRQKPEVKAKKRVQVNSAASVSKWARSFNEVLSGQFLMHDRFVKLLPFVGFVTALVIAYIFYSYQGEKTLKRIYELEGEIKELRVEDKTILSDLSSEGLQSKVAEKLKAQKSNIKESEEPARLIEVSQDE